MFCPECGHPTDPAPFDPHRAARKKPGIINAVRRLCGVPLKALQRSFREADRAPVRSERPSTNADPHLKKGTHMAMHHAEAGEVMKLRSISDTEAKTTALVKTDSFETIHLVVRAGEHIPDHKVGGSMSLYCIEGETVIDTPDGERQLGAGDWLYLGPAMPHAVRGITDASLILTVLFDRPTLHVRPPQR